MKRGLFIVLEGGEGVGKSTNMAFIKSHLQQAGIAFDASREPGGTELAEKIRELFLASHSEPVAGITELLLVFAARAQHLHQKILPVLNSGQWLVCDRFTDATYAYQGGGRHLGKATISALEQLVQGDLRPDCVIILDASIEVGKARAQQRAELDRMESEQAVFHQDVRDAYLERAAQYPDRYAVINAEQSLAQVQLDLAAQLDRIIAQWKQANE